MHEEQKEIVRDGSPDTLFTDGTIMINNELSNLFNNLYNRANKKNEAGGNSADSGKAKGRDNGAQAANDATGAQAKKPRRNFVDEYQRSKDGSNTQSSAQTDTAELSSEEKRQASLKKIMERIEAEEAQRYPRLAEKNKAEAAKKTTSTDASASTSTTTNFDDVKDKDGVGALLNDMPLFNEFKTSLMDAFRSMDGATTGSIRAQYELNYSSMQYIADAAGNYQYQETSFNLKLDLNYVKAGAGSMSGAEIADALENAEDFESFVAALQNVTAQAGAAAQAGASAADGAGKDNGNGKSNGNGNAYGVDKNNPLAAFLDDNGKPLSAKDLMNNAMKNFSPGSALKGLQDYFSPEATSGRIVDFALSFFPMSEAYKKGGDTEESRKEFAEMMRGAINKGFDQAMGTLGKVPDKTQSGIDKTHELAMKGLDDFIKNGMDKEKEDKGVYESLTEFAMSFEMSYSQKTVSVSGYDSRGQAQATPPASSLNAEA